MKDQEFFIAGQVFEAERHPINTIGWSPNGKFIAAGCYDGALLAWNAGDASVKGKKDYSDGALVSVAWAPDSASLATASAEGPVRILDLQAGTNRLISQNGQKPQQLAWSPSGDALAVVLVNGNVLLWDVAGNRSVNTPLRSAAQVAWSGDGLTLAAACFDRVVRTWNRSTGGVQQALSGHSGAVLAVIWSADGRWLVTGSQDKTIRLWDTRTFRPKYVLEGHRGSVVCVAFSPDGDYLLSQGSDDTIRVWQANTWETIQSKEFKSTDPSRATRFVLCPEVSPTRVALVAEKRNAVEVFSLNSDVVPELVNKSDTVHYANAKVVLVGDTSVGKTGLGLVLSGKTFKATESTHGRHVFIFERREITPVQGQRETREILLWDLAGQPGYRMIHQLHLDEVSVALVVFDSRSEVDPFAGVRHWSRALRLAESLQPPTAPPMKKFLVAARSDRGSVDVSRERLHALVRDLQFDGYFETSAKEGWHIQELREKIQQAITWEALPRVSSTALFQKLQRYLIEEKRKGRILSVEDDLFRAFASETGLQSDDSVRATFSGWIGRLEAQGLLRRLSFGELVLLQPELLDTYASMLVNAAKDEPDGLGSIPEDVLLSGRFRMPAAERLQNRETERLLLLATTEELLAREIALREAADDGVYYIFPSQFRRERPEFTDDTNRRIVFEFKGPVLNIYTTLAVRLSHCGFFTKDEMWQNAATYIANGGSRCGIALRELDEAHAELSLFFDNDVNSELTSLFENYIHHHLKRRALPDSVQRRKISTCSGCGLIITDQLAKLRLERGHEFLDCPVCGTRISLCGREETHSGHTDEIIPEMDRKADERREQAVTAVILEAKAETKQFDVFLAHKSKDKPLITKLADELRERRLNPWIDKDQIPPGRWFQDLIQAAIPTVRSAAICIGPSGLGRWQTVELRTFVSECVERGLPVIPVLLPGVSDIPADLPFLRGLSYVKFRKSVKEDDALDLLEWGITGQRPSENHITAHHSS